MSEQDKKDVQAVIDTWLRSLDAGDLQGMLDTCDPTCITANEKTPTTVGVAPIRTKYEARIAAADFKSGFTTEHIAIYGDFAVVVGFFTVEMTFKADGKKGGGSGRLLLGYRRHEDGAWKMVVDMDNNA
ncbi:DUF4440 domain-containing protein [Yoonia sp. SS1-5]|uniref:DUF4440 domain-containing protein n=1 Tax=Yoonia rhodophyticola TaxID=3137370 RepID=A0AAN0NLE7_9RHOB